ncbi:unnamed protein product [Cylindrotheca closterium]|uniref:DUF6824 domain-containing protein n=1 Tax=Cylindrotheca closterium TaxID=2856 RepID=A0AAD2G0Q3_9STRA|nr:unnamed protein product [Cylindrotheca closterium]
MTTSPDTSSPINTITALNYADVQVDNVFSMINTVHQHPGNRIFARIVNKNRPIFLESKNQQQKKLLVLSMIIAVQKNGGRFVQKNDAQEWVALGNKEAFGLIIEALKLVGMPLRPSILLNRKRGSIFKASMSKTASSKKVTISC